MQLLQENLSLARVAKARFIAQLRNVLLIAPFLQTTATGVQVTVTVEEGIQATTRTIAAKNIALTPVDWLWLSKE